jgi:hypothetical protein
METKNAVITQASIEIGEHGILTAFLVLDDGGACQCFGGYSFYLPRTGVSGKNYAGHFIYRVLEVAGVYKWEHLKGKAVRVVGDSTHIEAIGHIITDVWFNPSKEFEQLNQDVSA